MELAKLRSYEQDSTGYVLKDCPFCGGEARLMGTDQADGLVTYFVQCRICDASSDFSHKLENCVKKWNKRT